MSVPMPRAYAMSRRGARYRQRCQMCYASTLLRLSCCASARLHRTARHDGGMRCGSYDVHALTVVATLPRCRRYVYEMNGAPRLPPRHDCYVSCCAAYSHICHATFTAATSPRAASHAALLRKIAPSQHRTPLLFTTLPAVRVSNTPQQQFVADIAPW